ncbi:MAG TPA: hypothetical protein VHY18_09230 [Solirubrobacteraceae bacterium]|nr:hypothetical protein [Solirubrobacteraceae bacterium]
MNSSLRVIVVGAAKLATKPFVAILLAATTLLAAAVTTGLAWSGFWRTSMIPTTVAWFVGTAIVGTFSMGGVGEFRRLAARTVALTAIVVFVSNAYTFPLLVELLLVPSVVVLVTMASFVELRPEFANTRAPLKVLCVALFVGTITPTVVYFVQHIGELASADLARDFLLPFVLTVAFLPYLYLIQMVVVWQTALSMLKGQMQDRPALLKAARRSLIRSCHASLPRIQMFEPEFRWKLAAATSEEDIESTMSDFNHVAAERPWRKHTDEKGPGVRDLLPGASGSNLFVQSIALADSVQTALGSAATAGGHTQEEMRELLGRLDELNELSAVSPVSRAEMIRVLAQHRSISEIEVIAPELGNLSILHASDIVALASHFDSLLRIGGLSATEAPRIADELHTMSAVAGLSLPDTVQAFVTLLGGAVTNEEQGAPHSSRRTE